MTDFWTNFGAGLASGVVLIVLGVLIRKIIEKRSKGEPIRLNMKESRPLIATTIGFTMIMIDIFLVPDSIYLMTVGGMVLLYSALRFLK